VRGASATGMTGNVAKVEVHAAEVSMTKALEADAVEIPQRVEIPH
jgi:hypothetical protein